VWYTIDKIEKEVCTMGQTDKQFGGFLRFLISDVKRIMDEPDKEKRDALLKELLEKLQNTLED